VSIKIIALLRLHWLGSFWACMVLIAGLTPEAIALTQAELDLQRAKWNLQGISNYDYTLGQQCFCGPIVNPARVSVRSDIITLVRDPATMAVVPPPYTDVYKPVEELFDFLQTGLDLSAHTLSADFDLQLGYPRRIDFDFSQVLADDEGVFTASSLSIVPEPASFILILPALAAALTIRRGI
jgi:hypothetical protein